jgi:excisionase family DNA binding protein
MASAHTTQPETFWTVAQLATAWTVSKTFIYDLIAAGELESFDIGHGRAKTRIRQRDVDDYVRRRKRESAPASRTSRPAA